MTQKLLPDNNENNGVVPYGQTYALTNQNAAVVKFQEKSPVKKRRQHQHPGAEDIDIDYEIVPPALLNAGAVPDVTADATPGTALPKKKMTYEQYVFNRVVTPLAERGINDPVTYAGGKAVITEDKQGLNIDFNRTSYFGRQKEHDVRLSDGRFSNQVKTSVGFGAFKQNTSSSNMNDPSFVPNVASEYKTKVQLFWGLFKQKTHQTPTTNTTQTSGTLNSFVEMGKEFYQSIFKKSAANTQPANNRQNPTSRPGGMP